MLITRVKVENFKRWERLEVELRPLDCLVGANNSGKTTLLQALALFDFCVHHSLSGKNGHIELKKRTISPEEFYVLPCSRPADLWTNCRTQIGNDVRSIIIEVNFDTGLRATAQIKTNFNRFAVSVECSDESAEQLRALSEVHIAYLPVFSSFLTQEERKTPAVIKDELARGRVSSIIRNLLLDLRDEKRDGELLAVLRRVFPHLEKASIDFDEQNDRYISFTYQERGRPKEFDVFMAGSGFQQFVYLFGFIHLRQPTVILLDEPDVHLHGSLQQALLNELRQLVQAGRQVLFATHSRELVTRVDPDHTLSLDESGAHRLAVAFDQYDVLDRMGSLDATQLPIIQAYRRVLVVENESDWEILSTFCSKLLQPGVWPQVERRLALCYSHGNPWKQDIERLKKQIQQVVATSGQAVELFVVADRDYHPDLSALRACLPASNLQWHVWDRSEIENYLLNPAAILRLLGRGGSQMSLDEPAIQAEFERLVDASKDAANDRLVSAFGEYGRTTKAGWDPGTLSRKAREFLQQQWPAERFGLCDAKEFVLPGLKRWLQQNSLGQFSNRALAEAILPTELPSEVSDLAKRLVEFTGVTC